MRSEAGTSLGIIRHHKRPGLAARLGLPGWLRITFRNIGRNRRRTLLTILGVVATLTLLVTATGGKDSVDYGLEKYLHGVLRWDTAVAFSEPVGPDVLAGVRAIKGVTAAEPAIDVPAASDGGRRFRGRAGPGVPGRHRDARELPDEGFRSRAPAPAR